MADSMSTNGNNTGPSNIGGGIKDRLSSMASVAAGTSGDARPMPFLTNEMVGGSVPAIAGSEDETVWNAASQACGTEKIHYTYTVEDGRCWYLALPSSAMASNPNSWCPLAAALPGNEEHWDKETVYIYEQEGLASALRWDTETGRIQVFIGPSRTILPKIQSMDANFVTINPDATKPIPWIQRQLRSEQIARMTGLTVLLSGVGVALLAIAYILTINFMSITLSSDLRKAEEKTRKASNELMTMAAKTLQNDSLRHMVRVQELLDVLGDNDGTLVRYEVSNNGNTVEWEALVPQAFSAGGVPELRGAQPMPGLEEDGRVRIHGTR
jgi:hypothetical protein